MILKALVAENLPYLGMMCSVFLTKFEEKDLRDAYGPSGDSFMIHLKLFRDALSGSGRGSEGNHTQRSVKLPKNQTENQCKKVSNFHAFGKK